MTRFSVWSMPPYLHIPSRHSGEFRSVNWAFKVHRTALGLWSGRARASRYMLKSGQMLKTFFVLPHCVRLRNVPGCKKNSPGGQTTELRVLDLQCVCILCTWSHHKLVCHGGDQQTNVCPKFPSTNHKNRSSEF